MTISSSEIKNKAGALGYIACGIIPSTTFCEYVQYLDERAAAFPESKKLYDRLYANATPPEAGRSIIVCMETFPLLAELERYLTPEAIFEMSEDFYENVLLLYFSYPGNDGLWRWKTNALRSMINSSDSKYHHLIKKSRNSTDERIREIGRWGCEKLNL